MPTELALVLVTFLELFLADVTIALVPKLLLTGLLQQKDRIVDLEAHLLSTA